MKTMHSIFRVAAGGRVCAVNLRSAVGLLVFAAALALPALTIAQNDQEERALTYDLARQAMAAAEEEARANNWNVSIVLSDAAGVPVFLHRMDGAAGQSYNIAVRKAYTVVSTGLSSGEYGRRLEAGEIQEVEGGVTFQGGLPIYRDGELIGAIAASGVRGFQDEQIVQAGLDAITD